VTIDAVANRGLNLLATSLLVLGGLTFGAVFFQETDPSDKLDDGGFLFIAMLALVWYLLSGNRFARSMVPVLIAGVAVVVQVLGLVLERDDPKAFGDNVGGALYFGVTLILVVVQFRRTRNLVTNLMAPNAGAGLRQHPKL
jgi:hypothetical protein